MKTNKEIAEEALKICDTRGRSGEIRLGMMCLSIQRKEIFLKLYIIHEKDQECDCWRSVKKCDYGKLIEELKKQIEVVKK